MKTYQVKQRKTETLHHFSEEKFWLNANLIDDFLYPWEEKEPVEMQFKAQYDEQYFYFFFDVKSPLPIITFIKDNHKKEVLNSNRVELFFMSNKGMDPYCCLEMDSEKRNYDNKAKFYRIVDDTWS